MALRHVHFYYDLLIDCLIRFAFVLQIQSCAVYYMYIHVHLSRDLLCQ